jgi:hypothetical protein
VVVLVLTGAEVRLSGETTRPIVEVSARWTRSTSAGTARTTGTTATTTTAAARLASAVLCNVQTKRATTHFPTMNLLYGLRGVLLLRETHESETPGPTRFPIGRDVHVDNFTNFCEQLAELLIGRSEVQVTYKDLV